MRYRITKAADTELQRSAITHQRRGIQTYGVVRRYLSDGHLPPPEAVRVAAKEAVRKTLGGHGAGCAWRDVEIGREPSGAPTPRLTGRAR